MDSLLRMPGGCFEQTSSSISCNVSLAIDYMKAHEEADAGGECEGSRAISQPATSGW